MLGKACREKGELEGVASTQLNVKPSTPPNLSLALTSGDYNSHAVKGEGLTVLVVRDSESIIVCIKGGTKLTTKKKTLPLDNHIQMLGKPCREKGELEGVLKVERSKAVSWKFLSIVLV
ncbi:hypothetical protein VrSk94_15680 [Vibrio rotiferianus]